MGVTKDLETIRSFFKEDKYLNFTGVVIDEACDDYALCSLDVDAMHRNATGAVQGGTIFTLADSAFAVASNAKFVRSGEIVGRAVVSQSANITYYRQPKGTRLIATARKLSSGRVISVYEMKVTDELGTEVALMIGNGYEVVLK
jgi:acyl-CoA thioesterase